MIVICLECQSKMFLLITYLQPALKPHLKGFVAVSNWECSFCGARLKFYKPKTPDKPNQP